MENLCLSVTHGLDGCTLLDLSGLEGVDECILSFKCLSKCLDVSILLFDGLDLGVKTVRDVVDCGCGGDVASFKCFEAGGCFVHGCCHSGILGH